MDKSIVQLAVRDYQNPMGVATYNLSKDIPQQYQSLIPVIEGVKQILEDSDSMENDKEWKL